MSYSDFFQSSDEIEPENSTEILASETESEDEIPTEQDLAFIDDNDIDSSDGENEWVCKFLTLINSEWNLIKLNVLRSLVFKIILKYPYIKN